jgi:hypothetical protein
VLAIEHREQASEALLDRSRLEKFLALGKFEVQIDGDKVRKMTGILGIESGDFDLLGERRRELDDFLELTLRVPHHRRQLNGAFGYVFYQFEFRAKIRIGAPVFGDVNAPKSLDQHAHGVVRKLEHFEHARGAADLVHFAWHRVFSLSVALQDNTKQTVAGHYVVDKLGALGGFDEQRRNHSGKDDDIGQAKDGQNIRQ